MAEKEKLNVIIPAIKIFEKKKYAEQFLAGKIYFSAAGKFKQAKGNQRRYNEGKIRVNHKEIFIDDIKLDLPYDYSYTFLDRVPIFCCTLIEPENSKVQDDALFYNIPKEHYEFGDYYVLFDIVKLSNKLSSTNFGNGIRISKVLYQEPERMTDVDYKKINNPYDLLFIHHDTNHCMQNECRIVIEKNF